MFTSILRRRQQHRPTLKRHKRCSRPEKGTQLDCRHEAIAPTKLLLRYSCMLSGGDRCVNQTRPEDYLGDVGGR